VLETMLPSMRFSAPSTAAPASVYLDHYVQQHSNTARRDKMVSELQNLQSIDVGEAAGGFLEASEAAAGGRVWDMASMATLCDLAQLASEELRKENARPEGPEPEPEPEKPQAGRKRSRKSAAPVRTLAATKTVAAPTAAAPTAAAGAQHDGTGLSVAQIGQLYRALTTQPTKDRAFFKRVMSEHAAEFGVSITSLRNIVSFKNRRGDSSQFWNGELWALYNLAVRCETCRAALPKGSRVLCAHFGRGRPPANKTHREVVAARFRHSSAAPDELAKPREGNSGLKRAYLVQIRLSHVWACLGCAHSSEFLRSKAQALGDA